MKHINWDQEFPEVPDRVHRSVLDTLSVLDGQEVKKMKKAPRKRWIVLAAALVALVGTTAAAAGLFQWNERAEEVFQSDEETQKELTQNRMAQEVSQSVSDQGITITAIQTVQDKNRFYALFEVEAKDPSMEITADYSMDYTMDLGGKEDIFSGMGWHFISEKDQEVSNRRYFEIYGIKNEQSEDNLKMELHFTALRGEPAQKAGEGEVLVSGNWDFALDVHASDAVAHSLGKAYQLGGYTVQVQSVELTPLSMTIVYNGEDVRTMEAGKEVHLDQLDDLTELYPTDVCYEDGTVVNEGLMIPLTEGFSEDGAEYHMTLSFDKVVDASRVTALLMGEDRIDF